MDPSKFGDSYDIVKQAMLRWLTPLGTWAVHPMFAKDYRCSHPTFANEFRRFLDAPILTQEPIPHKPRRSGYFEKSLRAFTQDHLFFDPDKGLALPGSTWGKEHLTTQELCEIGHNYPGKLVLVYDQSFARMREDKRRFKTNCKLKWLKQRELYGISYYSHANFLLVSKDGDLLERARRTLSVRLPDCRLIQVRN